VTGFSRNGDGVTLTLRAAESDLVRSLTSQLVTVLEQRASDTPADTELAEVGIGGATVAPADPALARLLPDAYSADPTASAEHRRLTESGLLERKLANARTVLATLARRNSQLSADDAQAWLRTLTDLRLTLASRLGIESDQDRGTGSPGVIAIYGWLGHLQSTLVDAIDPASA
jgi:hypothetical protein